MKATKIRMKKGCFYSNNLLEIDDIYLEDCKVPDYYPKEMLHNYLQENPGTIYVNIYPYPDLEPAISKNNEKFVRSKGNSSVDDNLLALPRN